MPDGLVGRLWHAAWDDPEVGVYVRGLVVVMVVGAIVAIVSARAANRSRRPAKDDVKLPAQGRHFLGGLFARHQHPVRLGGTLTRVVFDIAWRHVAIVGTTGSRKSTLMAMLLERIGKTFAVISGDHAPPLLNLVLSLGFKVWRPRGNVPWYPWGGPLEEAVQRVEFMFPASTGDVGVHRSMFKLAARLAWAPTAEAFHRTLEKRIRDKDQRIAVEAAALKIGVDPRARDVDQVIALLPVLATGSSGKTMSENWIPRLQELMESLGDSIKTAVDGGIDVVETLGRGESFMFALNSFTDVSNRERFAKIATLEILRAADTVGNLAIAFDEVGLLGADLFAEAVRVLRVRLCTGLFASHIESDFPKVLKGLMKVWFLGQVPSSDQATRRFESDTTEGTVPPEHFGEHVLAEGEFYLVANGRVQRLRVPTWVTRPVPEAAGTPVQTVPAPGPPTPSAGSMREGVGAGSGVQEAVQTETWLDPPEWLAGDAQLLNIYRNVQVVNGHRLSLYHLNNRGRPLCTYDGDDWLPYALMLAMAEGRDLREVRMRMRDRTTRGLTCDHLCRELDPTISVADERKCQELSHLRWRTRGGNTQVQWTRRRRGVAVAVA